jgi:predicted small secreted protein
VGLSSPVNRLAFVIATLIVVAAGIVVAVLMHPRRRSREAPLHKVAAAGSVAPNQAECQPRNC